MQTRTLGSTQLEVPVISLGAWAIGGWYWGGTDDDLAVQAIRAALDAGTFAIDTAPSYGFGRSERVVGRAIQGRREGVVVMTKVGMRWDDDRGLPAFETRDANGRTVRVYRNGRPDSVRHEVEASLARLSIERIDLIQVHWPDPTTPIADTMGALLELRREGKVREIGVSNFDVRQLEEARRALGVVPLASDQPRYSLVERGIERDVLPWALRHRVGLLVYSPLDQGLLAGAVPADRTFARDDGRRARPTFEPENRARVNDILERVVRPIAEACSATLGQTVLAWTVAQPGITSALVGARIPQQARENAGAGALELSSAQLGAIDAAFCALRLEPVEPELTRQKLGDLLKRL